MTKRETHEIAVIVREIMRDECKEIENAYIKRFGSMGGMRNYVRNEVVAFYTDMNPYLDKLYLDYATITIGKHIINYDDIWCFIRDGLKEGV